MISTTNWFAFAAIGSKSRISLATKSKGPDWKMS